MSELVPNHTELHRKVLFDIRNNVSIVQSARRYGLEATTNQFMDRMVYFSITALRHDRTIDANAYMHHGIKFIGTWERSDKAMTTAEIKEKLSLIPADIVHWLLGNGSNLLPAGYGWDGKHTNIELVRFNKIKQMIIGENDFKNITNEVIDIIAESVLVSPSNILMMDWDKAIPFTKEIYPQTRNHDSKLFVFAQNDECSVRVDMEDDTFSFELDERYDRCIVVVTKYLTSASHPNYGASIELYKRKIEDDTR